MVERLLRRDQFVVVGAVIALVALASLYTIFGVGMSMTAIEMTRMARPVAEPMAMGDGTEWTVSYAVLIFLMWWVMMIAMMTPSAAPMLLLYTAIKRQGADAHRSTMLSLLFLAGYLLAWAVFSALASGLQWGFEKAGLIEAAMMTVNSRLFAGAILILAGLYQLSAFKEACLTHCRSPAQFLAQHRRPGGLGAVRLGAHHGLFCLGCCWALMALLFVGGIMNLWWIVALALYVLAEKTLTHARWLTRGAGWFLIAGGVYVVAPLLV